MSTARYKEWRKAVFTRDDFTCINCGKRGGWLEADHIKPWAWYIDLRYVVDNGRTLCKNCHKQTFKNLWILREKGIKPMTDGWVGFDLDGVLAHYDGWVDEFHIGEPIPAMIQKAKEYLSQGVNVRIFTARVSKNQGRALSTIDEITRVIQKWTATHIGIPLPVTCEKDYGMIMLYDDRCKQVIPNTGVLVEEQLQHEIENRLKLATSC